MVAVGNLQYLFMLNLYCGQYCKPSSYVLMSKGSLVSRVAARCLLFADSLTITTKENRNVLDLYFMFCFD